MKRVAKVVLLAIAITNIFIIFLWINRKEVSWNTNQFIHALRASAMEKSGLYHHLDPVSDKQTLETDVSFTSFANSGAKSMPIEGDTEKPGIFVASGAFVKPSKSEILNGELKNFTDVSVRGDALKIPNTGANGKVTEETHIGEGSWTSPSVPANDIIEKPNTNSNASIKSNDEELNWPIDIKSCFVEQNCGIETGTNACVPILNRNMKQCSHLMSVVRKPARSGNQMFQVAALLGAAFYHGYVPIIPQTFSIISIFKLPNVLTFHLENNSVFHEKGNIMYTESIRKLNHANNWTLTGYLQSWKYFNGCEGPVRKAFTFKEKYTTAARDFLTGITNTGYQNICIHVRRFSKTVRNTEYYNPSPYFIYRAVEYFKEKIEKINFILLSHDMKWVREKIKVKGAYFSPFIDPGMDMALMAHCDHVILTAGTFGWWGAWLSGGTVVYWQTFVDTRSKLQKDFASSYYPAHWIGMD